jgi:NADH-quinone oxidoreductase subunit H
VQTAFHLLVFPGFAFLVLLALVAEYVDRKLCARLQNRMGPPWFQPLADLIKLVAKEDLMPETTDAGILKVAPMVALASVVTAFLYIPLWRDHALSSFEGDVIVVLYLLVIPTLCFFLGGWYSRSVYSMIGATRSIMQLFAYEIPLFLSILAPAVLANTWSLSALAQYYAQHPWRTPVNALGLAVSLVAMLGKLERVPFDAPEAETEIVAGSFTEYSGRRLALFRLAVNAELVVGASLLAAVFLPFGLRLPATAGFVLYLARLLSIVCVLSLLRTVFARLRIDQAIRFCWRTVAPVAFLQLLVDLVAKGVLAP